MSRICHVHRLGLTPYLDAWKLQQSLVEARQKDHNLEDLLLLLQHQPVYTLGTGASLDYLKFELDNSPNQIYRIERGGEVTHHCPGQLVGYPIFNLGYYKKDLHWYLRQLERVIIETLRIYDLNACRHPGLTGVWLNGYKIAAIGIKVSRWITMHGFALNINADLIGFNKIIPCGLVNHRVGNICQFISGLEIEQVELDLIKTFASVFEIKLIISSKKIFY
jgi:lipoyl(octanoyl) transferase